MLARDATPVVHEVWTIARGTIRLAVFSDNHAVVYVCTVALVGCRLENEVYEVVRRGGFSS
jgi:hypothetical protein